MDEKILTPDQVAQILQVHPFTVLKFIKQGKLRASKLGRVYRIRQSDVMRFLDEGEAAAASKSQRKTAQKEAMEVPARAENQMTIQAEAENDKPAESEQSKESAKKVEKKTAGKAAEKNLLEAEETLLDTTVHSESKKQAGEQHHKKTGTNDLDHYILD